MANLEDTRPNKRVRETGEGSDMDIESSDGHHLVVKRPSVPIPVGVTEATFDPHKMPYLRAFDPAETTAAPACKEENPHLRKTRAGAAPELPLVPHPEFLEGPFPHTHIPEYRFFANLEPSQVQAIRERGEQMLALVMHGGGKGMLGHAKTIVINVEAFFRALAFMSNDRKSFSVKVYAPEVKSSKSNNPFDKPYTFFVDLGPNAEVLRHFLLWQEVFAVNPSLSFTVLPITTREASWKLCVIIGDDIDPEATHAYVLKQKTRLLVELKKRAGSTNSMSWWTAKLVMAGWNIHGNEQELVEKFTDTFSLELTTAELKSTNTPVPAYVLYAKPLTYDKRVAVNWRNSFLGISGPGKAAKPIRLGLDIFPVDRASVDCKVCKADTHRTAECPLAGTPGWKGVTPALIGKADKMADQDPSTMDNLRNPVQVAEDMFRQAVKRKKTTGGSVNRGKGRGGRGGRGGGSSYSRAM